MLTISINNATFNAPVGLYAQEKHTFNTIEVDLSVSLDAAINDLPLIDYSALYQIIKMVMENPHETLETIVTDIYKTAKALVPKGIIAVKVRKLHPPINGKVDYAEVGYKD